MARPGPRRTCRKRPCAGTFRLLAAPCTSRPGRGGMNKPIRRVAFVAMMMFALLLANGTYMMIFRQSALAAEPQNRRVRDAEFAQNRGSILAAGKTEIAKTEPIDDRSSTSGSTPTARCTRRSPASTPTTTRGPRWRTATTPSSPAPTTRCSSAGWSTSPPTGPPAGRQRADHHRAQDPGGGGRGAWATRRARWSPSTRAPGPCWPWSPARATTPTTSPATTSTRPTGRTSGWPNGTTGRWPTGRPGRSIRRVRPSSW